MNKGIGNKFQQETKYSRYSMGGGELDWKNQPSLCHCEEPLGDEAILSLRRLLRPCGARNDIRWYKAFSLSIDMALKTPPTHPYSLSNLF